VWRRRTRANIAIDLDGSRLVDLDADCPTVRRALTELLGEIRTPEAATGRGSRLLFRCPRGTFTNVRLPLTDGLEVEIRFHGIAVVPPSVHITGAVYSWLPGLSPDDLPVAELPEALLRVLTAHAKESTKGITSDTEDRPTTIAAARSVLPLVPSNGTILEGRRNLALTSLVGRLFAQGLAAGAVLERALAINAERCRPPLPESEVAEIVASIDGRDQHARALAAKGRRMVGLDRYTISTGWHTGGPADALTNHRYGGLCRLLWAAWTRDGLPDDLATCARIARLKPGEARKLLEGFFELTPSGTSCGKRDSAGAQTGVWRNPEQEIERERAAEARRRRQLAGQQGGFARAAAPLSNATAMLEQSSGRERDRVRDRHQGEEGSSEDGWTER
jgi:hypothetical protein